MSWGIFGFFQMKPICDALLIAKIVYGYSYFCVSNTTPATRVFAEERLWHPKIKENSMFASDLSGRQDGMLG
jgi:hypothetical protein